MLRRRPHEAKGWWIAQGRRKAWWPDDLLGVETYGGYIQDLDDDDNDRGDRQVVDDENEADVDEIDPEYLRTATPMQLPRMAYATIFFPGLGQIAGGY